MTDHSFVFLLAAIAAACPVAAVMGHRMGNEKRDVRVMAAAAGALGSAALAVFSFAGA